jgi:hypothetical protein
MLDGMWLHAKRFEGDRLLPSHLWRRDSPQEKLRYLIRDGDVIHDKAMWLEGVSWRSTSHGELKKKMVSRHQKQQRGSFWRLRFPTLDTDWFKGQRRYIKAAKS